MTVFRQDESFSYAIVTLKKKKKLNQLSAECIYEVGERIGITILNNDVNIICLK